jgi:hypothetical protein
MEELGFSKSGNGLVVTILRGCLLSKRWCSNIIVVIEDVGLILLQSMFLKKKNDP